MSDPSNGPSDNLAQRGCVLLGKELSRARLEPRRRLGVRGVVRSLHLRRNEQKDVSRKSSVTAKWPN